MTKHFIVSGRRFDPKMMVKRTGELQEILGKLVLASRMIQRESARVGVVGMVT